MPAALPEGTFRFGAFQLDRRSGELRKHGVKIKLQDKPVQVLMLLLERDGQIVSREEIRLRLWSENTFVDFDNAISSAVRKVRDALSDNSDTPRFIETVARQGYRFVCPVHNDEGVSTMIVSATDQALPGQVPEGTTTAITQQRERIGENPLNGSVGEELSSLRQGDATLPRRGVAWTLLATLIVVIAAIATWWMWRHQGSPADANPLSNATFARFTDFPGDKSDAAISPDGKFVAFRADLDGRSDVWVGQVGTGRPVNLTKDLPEDPLVPIQNLGFSPDGSEIWLAGYRGYRPNQRLRLIPLMGGTTRAFLRDHAVNVAWSPDGKRLVFHTYDPGDPMFIADSTGANAHQIFSLGPGGHNHFPRWSPDGRWVYFVSGPWESLDMDLWRIASAGGKPERLTYHNADVRWVTPISADTVLYVAPQQDGSGPWLWALDVKRKFSRRISIGLEHYTTVAGTANGRRLVATVSNPTASLWRVPILNRPVAESDIKALPLPNERALAPRFAGDSLFFLSSRGTGDGLWRFQNGQVIEIWKGKDGPLLVAPAISPDARAAAIVLRKQGKLRLHTISGDGAEFQPLTDAIDVRGAPCWSPDGKWIVTGGNDELGPGLFKIPAQGGTPIRLPAKPGLNPVWSPDGTLIVYAGTTVSRYAPLLGVRPDGRPFELPPMVVGAGSGVNLAHHRFTPDGKGLIYLRGLDPGEDFWLFDLTTGDTRLLARLGHGTSMSFDITPDGRQIVFDRVRENSDIAIIDLPN